MGSQLRGHPWLPSPRADGDLGRPELGCDGGRASRAGPAESRSSCDAGQGRRAREECGHCGGTSRAHAGVRCLIARRPLPWGLLAGSPEDPQTVPMTQAASVLGPQGPGPLQGTPTAARGTWHRTCLGRGPPGQQPPLMQDALRAADGSPSPSAIVPAASREVGWAASEVGPSASRAGSCCSHRQPPGLREGH